MTSYDCIVIGAGPGGYVAAIRSAQLGRRTAVVERDGVGGRCLNHACIPAKTVLRAADVCDEVSGAGVHGVMVPQPVIDFDAVGARRELVRDTLTAGVARLLAKHGVDVITGEARLVAPDRVAVGGRELQAGTIILATGSVARALPGVPFGDRIVATEEAWRLPELPARLAVVGAGPSGVELASAYARLGSAVVLLEAADQVLPGEDADVARLLARKLTAQGVDVRTGAALTAAVEVATGPVAVAAPAGALALAAAGAAANGAAERGALRAATNGTTASGAATEVELTADGTTFRVDWLVIAAGRSADVEALGLDALGIERTADGLLAVDTEQRTSVAGVFAIGDLVAGPALAHKASEEGVVAAEAAAGEPTTPVAADAIPRVTFASPAVASVGMTEAAARAAGHDVTIGKVPFGAVGAATVHGGRDGFVKLVADAQDGALLGAHVVGLRAAELIGELVLARALHAGIGDVARVIHGHPTMSEAVLEAARAADGWLIHG